jgi:hypothetical protein
MTYVHNGKRANLDALRIRQQIAAAEVEAAERELAAILDAEMELARLQRRKEQVALSLQQARERTTTARVQLALPPVIHGGPDGLKAAAEEVTQWLKRRKEMSMP